MKNKYIKAGVALLCVVTLSTVIAPTVTTMAAELDKTETEIIQQDNGTIDVNPEVAFVDENTVQFGDDSAVESTGYNQFTILENGNVFEQEFFVESNIIKINESYYDLDQYVEALKTDTVSVTEALQNIVPIELTSSPSQENTSENANTMQMRATLPKTGYGTLKYAGVRQKINMKVVATAAAGAVLVAFLFPGAGAALGVAFAKTVIAKGIAAGVIAYGTQAITTNVYYELSQAFHKTTSGAVKEQRKPYTQIQNKKFYGNTYTTYFWGSRPY